MAYEFTKLADVPALEEVPEGANAFIEVEGEIKRVPGDGLGGGGGMTTFYYDDNNKIYAGIDDETPMLSADFFAAAEQGALSLFPHISSSKSERYFNIDVRVSDFVEDTCSSSFDGYLDFSDTERPEGTPPPA